MTKSGTWAVDMGLGEEFRYYSKDNGRPLERFKSGLTGLVYLS